MSKQPVPTVSGEDLSSINERFQEDGFIIVENAVPSALIADVKSEINEILTAEAERHLPTSDKDANRFDACLRQLFDLDSKYRGRLYEVLQDMVSINRLCTSEVILEVVHALGVTAPNVRNVGTRIDIPSEDDYLQPIHQDVNSMRTENCVNCWIPLQNVTPDNGALRVWGGSHEIGPIRAEKKNSMNRGTRSSQNRWSNYTKSVTVQSTQKVSCSSIRV